jgi:hypothetical protein
LKGKPNAKLLQRWNTHDVCWGSKNIGKEGDMKVGTSVSRALKEMARYSHQPDGN